MKNLMCRSKKIFISIASYRDPELRKTILYASKLAKYPENLIFGICHQRDKNDAWDSIDDLVDDRFRVLDVDYRKAESVCVARSQIQALHKDEPYYFQIDSHTRFVRHWDERLLITYSRLKRAIEKPIVSTYLPAYFPKNDPDGRSRCPLYLTFSWITPPGIPFAKPHHIVGWEKRRKPVRCGFLSGHFLFTASQWIYEVPYDPEIYFQGEEPTLAARSYTSGYDTFAPIEVICWHEYTRSDKKKVWGDLPEEASNREGKSVERIRSVLGIDGDKLDYGKYGLGKVRPFQDYQDFLGVDYKHRRLKKHTIEYKHPPCPKGGKWFDYQTHCLDVQKSHFTYGDDYDRWVIGYRDKKGETIHERTILREELKGLLATSKDKLTLWTSYYGKKAHRVILWASHKEAGWVDKLDKIL